MRELLLSFIFFFNLFGTEKIPVSQNLFAALVLLTGGDKKKASQFPINVDFAYSVNNSLSFFLCNI